MNQIIKIAWDLNENTENRYQLVYEIAELAKKLVDENQLKRVKDEFSFDEVPFDTSIIASFNSLIGFKNNLNKNKLINILMINTVDITVRINVIVLILIPIKSIFSASLI